MNIDENLERPADTNPCDESRASTKDIEENNDIGTPSKMSKLEQQTLREQTQGKKILTFIGCVMMIYFCQILHGIIEQRIYKVPYTNTTSSYHDFYTDPLSPMVFSALFAAAIGFLQLQEHELATYIPFKKLLKIALLQIGIHFSLMWALMNASYILVVMVNSCGLLSVIVVSVYFSRQQNSRAYEPNDEIGNNEHQGESQGNHLNRQSSESKKLGPEKILICLIVCLGIGIFNYFTPRKDNKSAQTSQSASFLTFLVLGLAIVLQGFRPQLQSEIKREYQPSPISFYFNYHKVLCLVVLLLSILSWQLPYTINFILNHDELFLHIIILGLANAISAIFIYKIITLFRQHVYPLVSTVRKCITVGVSILYFGHHIQFMQLIGIVLVFGGVMLEIGMNYKLLEKWGLNLPFENEQNKNERYVKNKAFKEQSGIRKKYEVYKTLIKNADIQGI